MSGKNEEDFWNTSSSSGFNFDDDDELNNSVNNSIFFLSVTEETNVLPIHTIISKASLDLVLDDVKSTIDFVVPPVEETITKMLNGQKYILEVYRRLDDKLLLLDSALETCDSNIIINVILFLKRTLKANIFFLYLSKKKTAVRHYTNYLILNNEFQELADIFMATGSNSNMRELFYLIGKDVTKKTILYKRLHQFKAEHLQNLSGDEMVEVNDYLKFLEWQIAEKENCSSIIEQLAALCKKEWQTNNANDKIINFKNLFKIDDFSFEWTIMNVLASMDMWQPLADLFIKPNWLTKKNCLRTAIDPEVFILGLSKHKPPMDVLEQYLSCISDAERSMYLAQKLNLHKFIIQCYINQKDTLALINYKSKIPPESDEYLIIEGALQSMDKRWKN